MIDLRKHKKIPLSTSTCLKENAAYLIKDDITGKNLIVKLIAYYEDSDDTHLISEFKKMFLLSAEPEIGTVYYLASTDLNGEERNCYVMTYINGETIDELLNKYEKLSFDIITGIIKQIASGLEKAHHYEITHGDLHEGNILLDEFGFIKIIDFAFWDTKQDIKTKLYNDISSFIKITQKLCSKYNDFDKDRIEMILNLCIQVNSFKDLSKKINLIEDISFDYYLIDEAGKEIIALIINETPFNIKLSLCITERDIPIPSNPIFEPNDKEQGYIKKDNKGGLGYLDTREERILHYINSKFTEKLHQLKQANLIDWQVLITNAGEDFIGPYFYNFQISVTPKLLKWKQANSLSPFLNDIKEKSLVDYFSLLIKE
ncbi:MAG: protein kinase [Cytophagaceae bacterium]